MFPWNHLFILPLYFIHNLHSCELKKFNRAWLDADSKLGQKQTQPCWLVSHQCYSLSRLNSWHTSDVLILKIMYVLYDYLLIVIENSSLILAIWFTVHTFSCYVTYSSKTCPHVPKNRNTFFHLSVCFIARSSHIYQLLWAVWVFNMHSNFVSMEILQSCIEGLWRWIGCTQVC